VTTLKQKPLSEKYIRTIDFYFENGFNKQEAMLSAGWAEVTAKTDTTRFFTREDVKGEIARRQAKLAKKHELTTDWIITRLMRIANASESLAKFKRVSEDGMLYWDFADATPEDLKVISGLMTESYQDGRGKEAKIIKKFKIKERDEKGALDSLARIKGMFDDKMTVAGELSLVERLQRGRKRANKGE